MPDIVRANTHLASIVIGENAAKKILAGRQLARAEAEGEGEEEEEGETAAATTTARL
jgi:choline dehydrogenase-like flavoprotein